MPSVSNRASDCISRQRIAPTSGDAYNGEMPRRIYDLPVRDDPCFDRAAAKALLEAARVNETQLAERATGYYWGEPRLKPYMEELRAEAERTNDARGEQLARRFLR